MVKGMSLICSVNVIDGLSEDDEVMIEHPSHLLINITLNLAGSLLCNEFNGFD